MNEDEIGEEEDGADGPPPALLARVLIDVFLKPRPQGKREAAEAANKDGKGEH